MKSGILLLLLISLSMFTCRQPSKYIYNQGYIYGTNYHIVYESPEGKDLQNEITDLLNGYNKIFSTYDSTSVISKVNNNKPVELHPLFLRCYNRAMEISEITGGAFDITAGPMVNAWGFGPEEKSKMTKEIVDSLKAITGFHKVKLQNNTVFKENPNMKLDMSAIAKGFTSDLVGEFLAKNGCENYMVEIGGEVVARGKNEKGRVWTIGISKPDEMAFFASNDIQAKVHLPEHALATSGNYRNFYVEDGKKFAHTIDPKTGYPVQHSLLSTTVLADSCIDADAFATAFMVLGLEKSIEIAEQTPGIKVYFIYVNGEGENDVYLSEGFKEHLVK
ncbi:thiamine biosynthesis lipoprotein [Mariniphaga anaerophila]|uniref:FAD:protein FMN transferase n=1 Tax=Mariniphaga anaerophila TaxID=1484053 RepID=A0A1M4XZY7_9BACT|nr:FAD:protein FMN transferase [Mariniphaga anaerophila]SHE98883.1 thiamine biosynthesis lipoprotein [Mariniphaga anaerophila]